MRIVNKAFNSLFFRKFFCLLPDLNAKRTVFKYNRGRKNRKALGRLSDNHTRKWLVDILKVLKSILLESFEQQNAIYSYGVFFQSSGHSNQDRDVTAAEKV